MHGECFQDIHGTHFVRDCAGHVVFAEDQVSQRISEVSDCGGDSAGELIAVGVKDLEIDEVFDVVGDCSVEVVVGNLRE